MKKYTIVEDLLDNIHQRLKNFLIPSNDHIMRNKLHRVPSLGACNLLCIFFISIVYLFRVHLTEAIAISLNCSTKLRNYERHSNKLSRMGKFHFLFL